MLDPIHEQSLARIQEIEASKPAPAEHETPVFEAPIISVSLAVTSSQNIEEGDSAHIEGQFTPVADSNLKVGLIFCFVF